MISVEEAVSLIMAQPLALKTENVKLQHATGRVLAQEVVADRHFPPFDRVTMDGIAISFGAWEKGRKTFQLLGTQLAGEKGKVLKDKECALEVMTGAVLPDGCDTVIPYEEVEIAGKSATVPGSLKPGQNIHRIGSDQKKGTLLLSAGAMLGPAEIAVLATVGVAKPLVYQAPRVAVIATGDELVPIDRQPKPFQIRSSNSQALAAALASWKIEAGIFHLKDDKETLEKSLKKILDRFDVLLLSGGVSKGKADYLPEVLELVAVKKVFHKVAQKPGKPLWFGRNGNKAVFAFPGNPVSTFMCYHKYFLPWLQHSFSQPVALRFAKLSQDFTFLPSLTYFLQVKVRIDDQGEIWATPRTGGGSGDLANLLYADGFIELPSDRSVFSKGEVFPLISFKHL